MLKSVISVVAALLAATVSGKSAEANGATGGLRMAREEVNNAAMANQTVVPGDGWHIFKFTNVGYNATPSFVINNTASVVAAEYTDLYYVGDSFYMYVNGDVGASGTWMNSSSTANTTSNPDFAFASGLWSRGCVLLPQVLPGDAPNVITLSPLQSPFTGGAAAFRVLANVTSCPLL